MNIQSISNRAQAFTIASDTTPVAKQTQASVDESTNANTRASDNATTPQQVQEAVKSMNEFVGTLNSSLNFSVDNDTGKTIVKVMDSDTKEVLKQIPSEDMVAMAKAVDKLKGLLVHQKA